MSIRSVLKQTIKVDNQVCKFCQQNGSLVVNIYDQCFYLKIIPYFPLDDKLVVTCQHCFKKQYLYDLDQKSIENFYSKYKKKSQPIYKWTGIIATVVLLLFSHFMRGVSFGPGDAKKYVSDDTLIQQLYDEINPIMYNYRDSVIIKIRKDVFFEREKNSEFYLKTSGKKVLLFINIPQFYNYTDKYKILVHNKLLKILDEQDDFDAADFYLFYKSKDKTIITFDENSQSFNSENNDEILKKYFAN